MYLGVFFSVIPLVRVLFFKILTKYDLQKSVDHTQAI